MPARLLQFDVPLISQQVDYSSGMIRWWAFRETTNVFPAVFDFYDGTSAGGQLLLPISLAPGESTRDFAFGHVIPYKVGLFLNVISGGFEPVMQVDELFHWEHDALPVVIIGQLDITVNE